jgi:hypothetical protein
MRHVDGFEDEDPPPLAEELWRASEDEYDCEELDARFV